MARWIERGVPEEANELAERVKEAAFYVHRKLGAGFKEDIYQRCLAHTLARNGIAFEERVPLTVEFDGMILKNAGTPDYLVGDLLVVEIKAVEKMHALFAAQLINYLKVTGRPLGLLINFNARRMHGSIDRYVHPRFLSLETELS